MNDRLAETVSALIDGEADELEVRRLLSGDNFDEVRAVWRSFHHLGERGSGLDARFATVDISGRVMAAIDDIALERAAPRWWRPVASVAVAASVAAVVAVGVRSFDGATTQSQPQIAAGSASKVYPTPVAPNVGNVAVSAQMSGPSQLRPVALDADELARQQLDRYLLRHTERAMLNGGQGVVGFARVTELESE